MGADAEKYKLKKKGASPPFQIIFTPLQSNLLNHHSFKPETKLLKRQYIRTLTPQYFEG